MDVECFVCGEPWDLAHEFEEDEKEGLLQGSSCPTCAGCRDDGRQFPPMPGGVMTAVAEMAFAMMSGARTWDDVYVDSWVQAHSQHGGVATAGEIRARLHDNLRDDDEAFQQQWPEWFGYLVALGAERPHDLWRFHHLRELTKRGENEEGDTRFSFSLSPAAATRLLSSGVSRTVETFEAAFDEEFALGERFFGYGKSKPFVPKMDLYCLIYLGKSARHVDWLLRAALGVIRCQAFKPSVRHMLARDFGDAVAQLLFRFEGVQGAEEGETFDWHVNRNDLSRAQHARFCDFAGIAPLDHPDFPPAAVVELYSGFGTPDYTDWDPARESLGSVYAEAGHAISMDGYGEGEMDLAFADVD